jgi:hypothetical protein
MSDAWELAQVTPEGPDEVLGEYGSEQEALDAGRAAADFSETLYVVRHDGEDAWTNQSGDFARVEI